MLEDALLQTGRDYFFGISIIDTCRRIEALVKGKTVI